MPITWQGSLSTPTVRRFIIRLPTASPTWWNSSLTQTTTMMTTTTTTMTTTSSSPIYWLEYQGFQGTGDSEWEEWLLQENYNSPIQQQVRSPAVLRRGLRRNAERAQEELFEELTRMRTNDREILERLQQRYNQEMGQHNVPPPQMPMRPPITEQAQLRAKMLLFEHLTPEQQATFERHGWFIVEGGKSKTKYRVRNDRHLVGNVDVLRNDRVAHRLCAHMRRDAFPEGDHLLAQMLMLELDEDRFLQIANVHIAA